MSHINLKKLGDNIKLLRHQERLSQEQLAELSDLHRTYIGSVERGERNVSILNLIRLAKALNTTVSKITNKIE